MLNQEFEFIAEKIENIIKSNLKYNIEYMCRDIDNYRDIDFFEIFPDIKGRDLAIILYYIEKEFNVKISDDEILKGNFNSINNIVNLISINP